MNSDTIANLREQLIDRRASLKEAERAASAAAKDVERWAPALERMIEFESDGGAVDPMKRRELEIVVANAAKSLERSAAIEAEIRQIEDEVRAVPLCPWDRATARFLQIEANQNDPAKRV